MIQKTVQKYIASQVADTSLGVPDFSEIIGKPFAASVNFGFPRFSIGFSPFFGLPSALDLSKDPVKSKVKISLKKKNQLTISPDVIEDTSMEVCKPPPNPGAPEELVPLVNFPNAEDPKLSSLMLTRSSIVLTCIPLCNIFAVCGKS